ncbi:hypothetical protein [Lysobacter capsici]|uniref:hypothetical protein n=1 Tax=Lysobacter capsici TaxID=435897 RepID=UPI00287B85BE|nr:hypothetical protein [Lysobacter capsici]WND78984.1 hypothetical protein RJ610_16955 [Lysobacter capsici]WND84179.1 hypothetical protein RJ609_16965 [Lysobacter capsici]
MPVLHGPKHLDEFLGSPDQSLQVRAATLGQALAAYQDAFRVRIAPAVGYDGRYFLYFELDSGDELLIDIHVRRGDDEFCVRQDHDLPLQDDDVVLLMAFRVC